MVSLTNKRPGAISQIPRQSKIPRVRGGAGRSVGLHYWSLPCTLPSKGSSESARRPSPAFFNQHSTPKSCWKYLKRIHFYLIFTLTVNVTPFKRKFSFS